jgi:hypothetical protein
MDGDKYRKRKRNCAIFSLKKSACFSKKSAHELMKLERKRDLEAGTHCGELK